MSTSRCLRSYIGSCRQLQISNAPRSYLFSQTRQYVSAEKGAGETATPPAEPDTVEKDSSQTVRHAQRANIDTAVQKIQTKTPTSQEKPMPKSERPSNKFDDMRMPLNVAAVYLAPIRIESSGPTTCQVQMRSYSVRNLELMADFAMRAAFYLGLSASGPVPLPKKTERWTVLRSNFVHKTSQENFERITRRRLIDIKGGHPEVVQTWLAYLRKHAYHGVGMKANVWEHENLDVAKSMDGTANQLEESLRSKLTLFGSKALTPTKSTMSKIRDLNQGLPRERLRDRAFSEYESKKTVSEPASA